MGHYSADELQTWTTSPPWMDGIDPDELGRLASLGYTPGQIAMYYKIPEKDFLWYFHLVGSPLKYHYDRGQLVRQAKEAMTMQRSAEAGNTTQGQRLDKQRQAIGYRNSIHKIFFDDV